jgi:outer membrane receptor protein involved in Fe transport
VGAVLAGQSGELRGSIEAHGFALFIDDMIAYRRTAQFTVKAENIDSARILGVELGTQGSYGRHLSLGGSLTTLHTRNQFDKSLPLRAPLQFSLRPEVAFFPAFADRASMFVELEHVSFVYLDPANLSVLDGRTFFSIGGALRFLRRMTLGARAQNLFDVQATDVLSRPLPGFQFLVTLAVEESLQ